jgi:hypothetical protein
MHEATSSKDSPSSIPRYDRPIMSGDASATLQHMTLAAPFGSCPFDEDDARELHGAQPGWYAKRCGVVGGHDDHLSGQSRGRLPGRSPVI